MTSPVLLVHSGGFNSRQWQRLVGELAPRYRTVAPDLIGYGPEPWPLGKPFHFRQDVDRLVALLSEQLGDEPAHLVGHSYGGFVAMQLALAVPDRVASLAAYEPVAFGILDEPDDPRDATARASIDKLGPYVPDDNGIDEHWLTDFVDWWNGRGSWARLGDRTKADFYKVAWKLSQEVATLVDDRTDRAGYAAITVPTLLLGGERSQPAELRVLDKLAATLPNASLRVFPELGHMGPITHAPLVNTAIALHIDAVERALT